MTQHLKNLKYNKTKHQYLKYFEITTTKYVELEH